MELVDAFDQAGPSYPNVYGKALFSNQNNFRGRNYIQNRDINNSGAKANFALLNKNFNYNRGHGFAGQNYRNDHFSCSSNASGFEGHNHAPTSHPGTNQAHDYNRRDMLKRNYNPLSLDGLMAITCRRGRERCGQLQTRHELWKGVAMKIQMY